MNLIFMNTKVDHLNAWWEPHATSTPLKKIPAKLEINCKAQNRVLVLKDSDNVPGKLQNARNAFGILQEQLAEKAKCVGSKRNRKGRLSTYFDPSSSSDDDSGEIKKRPIIKLGSKETNTKTLLSNKEPNNEEISIFNLSPNRNLKKNSSIKNSRKSRKNISENGNKKNQNDLAQNKKNKADSFTEDIFTISDEENKIFSNSKRNTTLQKENESFLEKKVNSINYSRSDENSKHPSEFNETERRKLAKTPKASLIHSKSKQIKRNSNKNSQALRNHKKDITSNNKLSKFPKINTIKITTSTDSLKNRIRNPATKKVTTSTPRQTVITASPLLALENKLNLSHQLFSESREQECINILDLKSDEENEVCTKNKDQEEKLKVKIQAPEKHFTLKDRSFESPVTTAEKEPECGSVLPRNDGQTQIGKLSINAENALKRKNSKNDCKKKSCIIKNQKDENVAKQEAINVTKNETAADDPKNKKVKNQLVNNDAVNCSSSSPERNTNNIQRNKIHTKGALKCAEEKISENSVFKQLDELSFNENGFGCSAVQCWNVNYVKCGVFKLKVKAQLECQTLHSNSHLGGVLVKGHLRMKIGTKEQELKEGDMVFVPPLTEWRATNIGECESVFYYWCGRFGS